MRFGLGIGLAVAHFTSPGLEDGETGSATMTETMTFAVAATEANETGSQTDTEVFTMAIASTEDGEVGASGNGTTMAVASTEANETASATATEVFTAAIASTEAAETGAATMTHTANPILALSGLQFYVDTALTAPTATGADVTAWSDISGNARHLNTVSATKPQLLGDGAVQFLAANSTWLARANQNLVGTAGYCIGIVMRLDAVIDNEVFFGDSDVGAGGVNVKINTTTALVDHYGTGVGARDDTHVPPDTTTYHVYIFDRSGAGVAPVFYRDNVNVTGFSTTTDPVAPGTSDLILGAMGVGHSANSSFRVLAAFICNAGIGATAAGNVRSYWQGLYGTP